ncbi:MAG: hypothetical protein FJX47_07230 [Alphaproteobacteria bacterium]|nr:hypothetical protein [Alphaproteobacteria bacterium]
MSQESPRPMSPELKALLEKARTVVMTAEEREAQRQSFAYGNTHFENQTITREMVRRQAELLRR